ncbi:MAG TPA: hypothetical protein PLC25_03990 [Bacilli bacterium]|nr:hypothetical protein [Bacilli bacterium]
MKNKRIRKFTESIESGKFQEVIDELESLIESTIDNSGGEMKSFIESFIKDPNEVKIEGLINESDIYDFYLKYRNQIDECLNDINFYDNPPSEIGALGLYEYTIKGTMVSVQEFIKQLSK